MNHPMMKCGHAANAVDTKTGNPCCVICSGIDPGADVIDDSPPNLNNRLAKCSCCNKTELSNTELAFFKYRSEGKLDSYYCGCRGWD
jgi:hypothetical protein